MQDGTESRRTTCFWRHKRGISEIRPLVPIAGKHLMTAVVDYSRVVGTGISTGPVVDQKNTAPFIGTDAMSERGSRAKGLRQVFGGQAMDTESPRRSRGLGPPWEPAAGLMSGVDVARSRMCGGRRRLDCFSTSAKGVCSTSSSTAPASAMYSVVASAFAVTGVA